jgi:hypothetical protein
VPERSVCRLNASVSVVDEVGYLGICCSKIEKSTISRSRFPTSCSMYQVIGRFDMLGGHIYSTVGGLDENPRISWLATTIVVRIR